MLKLFCASEATGKPVVNTPYEGSFISLADPALKGVGNGIFTNIVVYGGFQNFWYPKMDGYKGKPYKNG